MSDKQPIGAYSEDTNTHYDSWDDLVKAESNGLIVTAVLRKGKSTWTWSRGPYDDTRLATNAKQRLKAQFKREQAQHPDTELVVINIRPLWKDPRNA